MLLNHEIGEIIEGMDDIFHVVPVSKYGEQSRLTTTVERVRGKKFKRKVPVEIPIHVAAMEWIRDSFTLSGLAPGSDVEIIVQEYPASNIVMYVAAAVINGQAKFVTAPFKLSDQQVADLTLRGLWQPLRVN